MSSMVRTMAKRLKGSKQRWLGPLGPFEAGAGRHQRSGFTKSNGKRRRVRPMTQGGYESPVPATKVRNTRMAAIREFLGLKMWE